jgi:hypothetical protein
LFGDSAFKRFGAKASRHKIAASHKITACRVQNGICSGAVRHNPNHRKPSRRFGQGTATWHDVQAERRIFWHRGQQNGCAARQGNDRVIWGQLVFGKGAMLAVIIARARAGENFAHEGFHTGR